MGLWVPGTGVLGRGGAPARGLGLVLRWNPRGVNPRGVNPPAGRFQCGALGTGPWAPAAAAVLRLQLRAGLTLPLCGY